MSAEDEESEAGDDAAEDEAEGEPAEEATLEERLAAVDEALSGDLDEGSLASALDEAEGAIELAETEADLDEIDEALDDVATAIENADLPEPEEEDEEDPREELEARLEDLRNAAEESRGPYADDVIAAVEDAKAKIADTRWTEQGEGEIVDAVAAVVGAVNEILDADVTPIEDPDGLDAPLDEIAEAVDAAALDPDDDAATLADLVEATDALAAGLEDAQEWDDLTTREQLDAHGFYDVLDHRKDFPPEWHALKVWEKRGNAEMILLALEKLEADFMEEHCLEALQRMGPEEAFEPMLERAERRDVPGIRILGKIANPEAVDTIVEFVGNEDNPQLQKTTLTALGEIGDEAATQAVADALASDNESVRIHAARALGMLGDTRAIEPLADVLANDDAGTVRGAAAWALNQIGTERALAAASEYADDRYYLVQAEAEKAAAAIDGAPA